MKKRLFGFCLFTIIMTSQFYGQQSISDFSSAENPLSIAFILYSQSDKSFIQNQQLNNGIFISQIGENNIVNTEVHGQSSISLNQQGSKNYVELNLEMHSIEGNIHQNGNGNFFYLNVFNPDDVLILNIKQEGNNHHFESHGSNSISDNLNFKMTGDSRTIIVRNFQ